MQRTVRIGISVWSVVLAMIFAHTALAQAPPTTALAERARLVSLALLARVRVLGDTSAVTACSVYAAMDSARSYLELLDEPARRYVVGNNTSPCARTTDVALAAAERPAMISLRNIRVDSSSAQVEFLVIRGQYALSETHTFSRPGRAGGAGATSASVPVWTGWQAPKEIVVRILGVF